MVHTDRQSDDRTRAMYRRYLSSWAMDVLELRRQGLDRPCVRESAGAGPVSPGHDSGSPGMHRTLAPARL